jgi:hypothetical protein
MFNFNVAFNVASLLPPPLRERVGVGGNCNALTRNTPLSNSPPQGGRGCVVRAARLRLTGGGIA